MICKLSSRETQVDSVAFMRGALFTIRCVLQWPISYDFLSSRLTAICAAVIKSRNKDGWTPLHQAAYAGSLKCAEVTRPPPPATPCVSPALTPTSIISFSSLPKPTS